MIHAPRPHTAVTNTIAQDDLVQVHCNPKDMLLQAKTASRPNAAQF